MKASKKNAAPADKRKSDSLCKQLAEAYPAQFAAWLFGVTSGVQVDKTELSREPVRADSVIFAHAQSETLHAEFQTTMKSDVPVPLRLLDYHVGLKRRNPQQIVRQVLVVLSDNGEPVPDRYEDETTLHVFGVVRMWEQDPAELLEHEGLLPLATLCHAASGEQLLGDVADRIKRIKSRPRRREALNWSRLLAGLRYDNSLIGKLLKESDMLEESVIYQDIFQKGQVSGQQKGQQEGARELALYLLEQEFGALSHAVRQQIERLMTEQLKALCGALKGFKTKQELTQWLKRHARPAK